jgi:hypothetical protein
VLKGRDERHRQPTKGADNLLKDAGNLQMGQFLAIMATAGALLGRVMNHDDDEAATRFQAERTTQVTKWHFFGFLDTLALLLNRHAFRAERKRQRKQ